MNNGYKEVSAVGNHLASSNGMVYEHRLVATRTRRLDRLQQQPRVVDLRHLRPAGRHPRDPVRARPGGDLPGRPGTSIYQLHNTRLTTVERSLLIKYMTDRHGLSRTQAELYLENPGVIIYADDVTCSTPAVIGL